MPVFSPFFLPDPLTEHWCLCLQIPITPFDNKLAFAQMEVAYTTLLNRPTFSKTAGKNTILGKDNREHPRIVRLAYHCTILY
jgi:agmatinase